MSTIDSIKIQYRDGAPIWLYKTEMISVEDSAGNVVAVTPNIVPLDPTSDEAKAALGDALPAAIAEAQKQAQIATDAVASRDAALARVDNLESQITALQAQAQA